MKVWLRIAYGRALGPWLRVRYQVAGWRSVREEWSPGPHRPYITTRP